MARSRRGSSPQRAASKAAPAESAGIENRVNDPGFTPGLRDLDALLALLALEDDEIAKATERAVLRIEARHSAKLVSGIVARLAGSTRPLRGRLARLLGRLAMSAPAASANEARAWLVSALADSDPKTRHTAARALGKLPLRGADERATVERALLDAWDAGDIEDRRALAEALGKLGSEDARERLAELATPGRESAVVQRVTRAALMIDREVARKHPGIIDLTRGFEGPVAVRFHARAGLEEIVAAEIGDVWRPRVAGPGLVDARLEGPLARAAGVRTAMHVGFPMDPVAVRGDLAEAITSAILSPRSLAILSAFTRTEGGGAIRFRLSWSQGGHRRALAWRCAELVAARSSAIVNDPTESTWEIKVDDHPDRVAIELVPRGFLDDRFLYRRATVPASSHPTIAAALVRLVPARADDVVWDPFVGAGAELVERAKVGAYRSLVGSDIDEAALSAARTNLDEARVERVRLERADATTHAPKGVTVIITNPPMGRRVQRGTHTDLLDRFVDRAARVLGPAGALVWAVPDGRRFHARAERAGLVLERAFTVDMGGFPAELSVHRKRATRG